MTRVTLERRLEHVAAQVPRAPEPDHGQAALERWCLEVFGRTFDEIDYDAIDRAHRMLEVGIEFDFYHPALMRAAAGPLVDPSPDRLARRRWYPPDPDDADAQAQKQWIRDWCADPNRAFRAGADLTAYFTWLVGDLDDLTGTELERLPMLLEALDQSEREQPGSTVNVPTAVFMAAMGWVQGHCKWRAGP
jgi:hypothetical protein